MLLLTLEPSKQMILIIVTLAVPLKRLNLKEAKHDTADYFLLIAATLQKKKDRGDCASIQG